MPSTKYAGLSYRTHFLKSRDSVIRNSFLEYRTHKATYFARRNDYYAFLSINKAKYILNRLFSCSCSDTISSESIKKHKKSPIFESIAFLYKSTFSECKGGSCASGDRIINLKKNKLATNR